jgi:hypothetical protein
MTAIEVLPHTVDVGSLVTGMVLVFLTTFAALVGLVALNLFRRLIGSAAE